MGKVYISLGSNIGDREKNIQSAIKLINDYPSITVVKLSPIYETEPIGFKEQNWFLNAVIELETTLLPEELLVVLKQVEAKLGKKIEKKWGPRTIDLDILLYDDIILNSPNDRGEYKLRETFDTNKGVANDEERKLELQIPHKLMHKRAFVLVPLVQIAPDINHPLLNKTMRKLLNELKEVEKCHVVLKCR